MDEKIGSCEPTFTVASSLFDANHLEIANGSNLIIVFYPLGNFGQALCIGSCHEDQILTRKSHNCVGIAFIQGDSVGGSKLIEQTLKYEAHIFKLASSSFSENVNLRSTGSISGGSFQIHFSPNH